MNNIPDYDKDRKAFALFAGEVLGEKPYEHDEFLTRKTKGGEHGYRCRKCGEFQELDVWSDPDYNQVCSIPDPIDCEDWNTAMKWFRQIAGRLGKDKANHALYMLCHKVSPITNHCYDQTHYSWWLAKEAQPHHYIEAVVRLVLKEKE